MTRCEQATCSIEACGLSAWCAEHAPDRWTAEMIDRSVPPTTVKHYPNGSVWFEEWFIDGKQSRSDGPAGVYYDEDGKVVGVTWLLDDVVHREGAPASVEIGPSFLGWTENYVVHGHHHRLEGPAVAGLYADGTPRWTVYLVDDVRHRVDGPAETWKTSGPADGEKFYLHDVEVTAEALEPYREAIANGAPPEWALSYALAESAQGWLVASGSPSVSV